MSKKNVITKIPRTPVNAPKSLNDASSDDSNTGNQKTMKSSRTGVDAPKDASNNDLDTGYSPAD